MKREEQMMEEAEAYAAGLYADEPVSFSTEESKCETICDFRAGWMAADSHPHWIPVEEELPPASCGVISDPVLVFIGNNKGWCGYIREGFYNHAAKEWSYMNRRRTHKVTHWMEIVPPKKGGEQ